MPVERVSKQFKDISASFKVNPINYDLIDLKNERAISRSLQNLVLTNFGERFFNQNLGSGVNQLLFDQFDSITAISIEDKIRDVINNFEPRVKLISLKVIPNDTSSEYDITITYSIIGIEAQPQQLSFALQSTR